MRLQGKLNYTSRQKDGFKFFLVRSYENRIQKRFTDFGSVILPGTEFTNSDEFVKHLLNMSAEPLVHLGGGHYTWSGTEKFRGKAEIVNAFGRFEGRAVIVERLIHWGSKPIKGD